LDHNRVHLIGRLVKAPQFFPPGRKGHEHCTFSIAVNRVVPNEEGPTADYLPCSLWGPEAVRFCEIRDKGDEVGILGRIRTNFVPQASGDKKFFWEIRVEHVEYGRRALKNLRAAPRQETVATQAVRSLNREFGE